MAIGLKTTWRGLALPEAYFTISREFRTSSYIEGVKTWGIRVEFSMFKDKAAYKAGEAALEDRTKPVVYTTSDESKMTITDIYTFAESRPEFDGCVTLK